MEKDKNKPNHFDLQNTRDTIYRFNEKKTTDINILLNRVRINKKIELKKKNNFFINSFFVCKFCKFFLLIY